MNDQGDLPLFSIKGPCPNIGRLKASILEFFSARVELCFERGYK